MKKVVYNGSRLTHMQWIMSWLVKEHKTQVGKNASRENGLVILVLIRVFK